MPMNGGNSVICCPAGRDCSSIGTISCDLQQQNATAHSLSQIFTTDLTTSLQKCGDLCCPGGMSCQNDNLCVMNNSTAASSSSATPSASSGASTSTPAAGASSANPTSPPNSKASNSASNQDARPPARSNQFAIPGLLVGFFSGLVLGVLLTILTICCIGRMRSTKRDSGDLSSVQASVSDPIYDPDASTSYRTDFLRRKSNNRTSHTTSRVKSFFSLRTPTTKSKNSLVSAGVKSPKTPSM